MWICSVTVAAVYTIYTPFVGYIYIYNTIWFISHSPLGIFRTNYKYSSWNLIYLNSILSDNITHQFLIPR